MSNDAQSHVQQSTALSLLRPITPGVLENRERTLSLLVDRREHKLESDSCSSHSQLIRQRDHVGASGGDLNSSSRELRGKNPFFHQQHLHSVIEPFMCH